MPQDSSLDFKLVQRICLLQQALDQATTSLEELQQQVANHQMLQAHLAQTEEYSNVQQKIILNLQQQLAAKEEWQHQVLEAMLVGIKRLIDDQQRELERLRLRIYQSQTEVQNYLVRLKNDSQTLALHPLPGSALDLNPEIMIARSLTVSLSSQLQAAQQHLQQLDHTLTRHQITFTRMQVYAKAPGNSVPESSVAPASGSLASPEPEADIDLDHLEDPAALRAVIEVQRQKINELSTELGKQFDHQTSLKSRCQEIAAERDFLKQQEMALRHENERLQAQVLPSDPALSSSGSQDTRSAIPAWQAAEALPHAPARLRPKRST